MAKAGADRVMLGSDYPFPIGDLTPRAVVEQATLPAADRGQILAGTAARLFGQAAQTPGAAGARAPGEAPP